MLTDVDHHKHVYNNNERRRRRRRRSASRCYRGSDGIIIIFVVGAIDLNGSPRVINVRTRHAEVGFKSGWKMYSDTRSYRQITLHVIVGNRFARNARAAILYIMLIIISRVCYEIVNNYRRDDVGSV